MRLKLLLPLIFCATLAACGTTQQSNPDNAQSANNAAQQANRQLIIDICEADAQICNCLADNLQRTFTPQEWDLFRTVLTSATPPAGVTAEQIQQLTNKLDSAAQACGQ